MIAFMHSFSQRISTLSFIWGPELDTLVSILSSFQQASYFCLILTDSSKSAKIRKHTHTHICAYLGVPWWASAWRQELWPGHAVFRRVLLSWVWASSGSEDSLALGICHSRAGRSAFPFAMEAPLSPPSGMWQEDLGPRDLDTWGLVSVSF